MRTIGRSWRLPWRWIARSGRRTPTSSAVASPPGLRIACSCIWRRPVPNPATIKRLDKPEVLHQNHPLANSERHRFGAGTCIELGQDLSHVKFHRVLTDLELPGDGLVGGA